MRHLPAIECGPGRWVLPMADPTALLLTELILTEDRAGMCGAIAAALEIDPPLALWTAVTATRGGCRLPTIPQLAEWLIQHAAAALQWPPESEDRILPAEEQTQRVLDLVREGLCVGSLAAELASTDSPSLRESASLAGLLHSAPAWFAESDANRARAVPEQLQEWLSATPAEAASTAALAAEILAGDRPSPGLDIAAVRRRAEQAAKAWATPLPGVSERLPILAARFARLEQLELRFHELLEHEKLEAMAELAAGAGHEINNPLAIIAGRAQLFLEDETDPERRREAAIIVAQVKRAHEMIADLRLFARPPRPEPQQFDLTALVESLLAESASAAAERSIALVRPCQSEPLIVELDPAQIRVAVQGIVRNALEAVGREGRVEIGLDADETSVTIRVADNGPGIAPQDRRHIFDPFFSARQAGRGLGMGLPKCWRIVTNHNGQIQVDSQVGRGTAFTVRLPRRYEPSQKPALS